MSQGSHEDLSRATPVMPGSDRAFGVQMSVILGLISAFGLWRHTSWWPWTGTAAALLLAAGLLYAPALAPLKLAWFKFGELLHKIVNPIVMGILFFVTVMPIGLLLRGAGKDLLRLRREPEADSYWISRQPPGPAPDTMRDQF